MRIYDEGVNNIKNNMIGLPIHINTELFLSGKYDQEDKTLSLYIVAWSRRTSWDEPIYYLLQASSLWDFQTIRPSARTLQVIFRVLSAVCAFHLGIMLSITMLCVTWIYVLSKKYQLHAW